MLTIWALDPSSTRRGMLTPTAIQAVIKEMDTDTYIVEIDSSNHLANRITIGWSLIIDDGTIRISGPITELETDITATTSTLTIHGVGELHRLADRLIYPNPAQEASKQTRARYTDKGPAETVIKTLVNASAGPTALPARRTKDFTVPATRGSGKVVTISERFSNLLEEARSLARLGGITFSAVRADDNTVPFMVRVPADLSRQIRVAPETGGASTGTVGLAGATVTAAIVAGRGEGVERYIDERTAPGSSRRIEVLKDRRDTDESDAVAQAADKLLEDGAETGKATIKVVETPQRRLGQHFQLGDTITVQLGSTTVSKPVRSAKITWDGFGREVELTIGDNESADDNTPAWVKEVKKLDTRLRGLEAR